MERGRGNVKIIFEVQPADEGGYHARAIGHSVFTQGDSWEELRANALEATSLHFEDAPVQPQMVEFREVPGIDQAFRTLLL